MICLSYFNYNNYLKEAKNNNYLKKKKVEYKELVYNVDLYKKYPFEMEAFKHDELTKMDKLNKDIEEKYKNISVYELKGKDIK